MPAETQGEVSISFDTQALWNTRTMSNTPTAYRLARKASGELVLQGGFAWTDRNQIGIEWQDLPTVEYAAEQQGTSEQNEQETQGNDAR